MRDTLRDSKLLCDPAAKSLIEAINGLRQFDAVRSLFHTFRNSLSLSPQIVCDLNRIAITGIYASAGQFRQGPVTITNTAHVPPTFEDVPSLTEKMCDYANQHCKNPLHCSAFLMWRLNWIHPFEDGNGRTSRAISYLALCTGYDLDLPGTLTIPDQISQCRTPYYLALDEADAAWRQGKIDVSKMESLIAEMLVKQLQSAV